MQAVKASDICSMNIAFNEKNVQVLIPLCPLQFAVPHSVSVLPAVKS